MTKPLKLLTVDAGDARIHVAAEDGDNAVFGFDLSIPEAQMLQEAIRKELDIALGQKPVGEKGSALPVVSLQVGETKDLCLLRVSITDDVHQTFAAPLGSATALLLRALGEEIRRENNRLSRCTPGSDSRH